MKYPVIAAVVFLLMSGLSVHAHGLKEPKYIDIEVLGWKVKVNESLLEGDTSILKKSLGLFGKELFDISNVVPPKALKVLKRVTFWFEKETMVHGYTGEYWSPESWQYLSENGENPEKAGGIEIVAGRYIDAKTLYKDWVILHELAHAYHHLVLQYDQRIQDAYKVIFNAGLYSNVRQGFDKRHHGYALTNFREYFAEITTMYFGHNSYYPFDRVDLKHYDPIGYKLVEDAWEVNEK